MKTILFVTTNIGKVETLRSRISEKKFKIVAHSLELPEIQANSAEEVVYEKAKVAYSLVKKPLLVHDSSFHISALNNFPGIYVKYINETIGLDGIMKLLEGVKDRTCYFEGSLAYADQDGLKVFVRKSEKGHIASVASIQNNPNAWSDLWKVYIPSGCTKTLSEFTDEELNTTRKGKSKSEFRKFAEWINTRKNI